MQRALAGPRLGSKRVQCITKFRYPNFLFTSPETHSLFVNAFLVWERKGVAANLICAILRCPTSLVASFPLQYLVRSVDTCTLAYSLSSARWHLLRGSSLLNNFGAAVTCLFPFPTIARLSLFLSMLVLLVLLSWLVLLSQHAFVPGVYSTVDCKIML